MSLESWGQAGPIQGVKNSEKRWCPPPRCVEEWKAAGWVVDGFGNKRVPGCLFKKKHLWSALRGFKGFKAVSDQVKMLFFLALWRGFSFEVRTALFDRI